MGNQVTKYPIRSVKFKEAGKVTSSSRGLWFDARFGRLNAEGKGVSLGNFESEDRLLIFYRDGNYEVTDQEMTQKFDPEQVLWIGKFDPDAIVSAVYVDQDKKQFMLKRFKVETTTLRSKFQCIKEGEGNFLRTVSTEPEPILFIQQGRGAQLRKAKLKIAKMAEVTGWRTVGVKMADFAKSTDLEWVSSSSSAQYSLFDS